MKYANYFKGGGLLMTDEEKVLLDFLKVNSAYEAKVVPGTEHIHIYDEINRHPTSVETQRGRRAVSIHRDA